MSTADLLVRMRLLEKDHEPGGWPAVQMRDISAMVMEIARLQVRAEHAWAAHDAAQEDRAKFIRVLRAAVELVCAPAWAGISDEDVTLERVLIECGYVHNGSPVAWEMP